MKRIFNLLGLSIALLIAFLGIFIWSNRVVIVGKNSAQASDLSEGEIKRFEQKAHEGDLASAAKLYWYYRFTKRDFTEAAKWEYATIRSQGSTNN